MRYEGTISPETMAALIASFRKSEQRCRDDASAFSGQRYEETRDRYLFRAAMYGGVARDLERAVDQERERILTPEDT